MAVEIHPVLGFWENRSRKSTEAYDWKHYGKMTDSLKVQLD